MNSHPDPFRDAREHMVNQQIRARGVRDEQVLEAMRRIPRHDFVPREQRHAAYGDHPLPVGQGQTISQPYIVAAMTEALELTPDSRVLEIGTGSGYQAAILAAIAAEVHSVEFHEPLHALARQRLAGFPNLHLHWGDGTQGWAEAAPYDAILATCAARRLPSAWQEQVRDGGVIVTPLGGADEQRLLRLRRNGSELAEEVLMAVRFVPLLGSEADGGPPQRPD